MAKKKTVTSVSKEELEALQSDGLITLKEKPVPVKPQPISTTMPVAVDTGVTEVAEATKMVAQSVEKTAAMQSEAMKSVLTQVSDAMRAMADKPTWTHIRIEVERGRNDLIRTADLKKIS